MVISINSPRIIPFGVTLSMGMAASDGQTEGQGETDRRQCAI